MVLSASCPRSSSCSNTSRNGLARRLLEDRRNCSCAPIHRIIFFAPFAVPRTKHTFPSDAQYNALITYMGIVPEKVLLKTTFKSTKTAGRFSFPATPNGTPAGVYGIRVSTTSGEVVFGDIITLFELKFNSVASSTDRTGSFFSWQPITGSVGPIAFGMTPAPVAFLDSSYLLCRC